MPRTRKKPKASRRTRAPAPSAERPGLPRDALGLLLLLSALLIWFQYTTLDKLNVLSPGQSYGSPAVLWGIVTRAADLNGWDLVTALLLIACGLAAVWLEVRYSSFTRLLAVVLSSERRTRLALGLACLVGVRFYFARGDLSWIADTSAHTVYAWIAARSFSLGEIPIWTNYLGAGSPFLQFYGFVFYFAVALLNLVIGNLFWSVKLVMAAGHVGSGLAMYAFIRRLCRSRSAGFLAGLAYVLSVWHTQQVLAMGRLPLSVFYALLPLPFYYLERLRTSRNRPADAALGAFFLGLLAFTHPGYAFWATVLLAGYALLRIGTALGRPAWRPWAGFSAVLLGAGIAFGAYLTVPMWLERAYTGLRAGFSMAGFPDPTWQHVFVWSSFRVRLWPLPEGHDHWYGGYVGLSLVLLSLALIVVAVRRRRLSGVSRTLPPLLCLAVSFLLVFGYRWPVLRDLQVIHALNAGRYLLFVVAFLSASAGCASAVLAPKAGRRFTLLCFLVLADLGPATFQQPYLTPGRSADIVPMPADKLADLQRDRDRQPDGQLPGYRVYYSTGSTYKPQVTAWLPVMAGAQSFLATHDEAPVAVSAFGDPFQRLMDPVLESEGRGVDDPGDYLAGLHLLNVQKAYALVSGQQQAAGWSLSGWTFPEFGPVVVSASAVGWPYPEEAFGAPAAEARVMALIHAMGVTATGTCSRILLADPAFDEDLGGDPAVRVLSHRVWNQRVELRLRVTGPCFARLAYAWYPYLRATVDGEPATAMPTAGRFIALRLPEGEHTIVLEPRLSPVRRALLALDLVLLAAGAWLVWRGRQRRKAS